MGEEPRKVRFAGSRRFLIVQSGVKRSTRTLIDKVSRMKETYPGLFAGLSSSASFISEIAATRLVNGDMEELGRLLTYNHAVLSMVGASTPSLDGLVDLLLSLGCYGAKLTGAGGGGSVVAIPREGSTDALIGELKSRGFEAFQTTVPCDGVKSWLK
jgi:mevalonate kinase